MPSKQKFINISMLKKIALQIFISMIFIFACNIHAFGQEEKLIESKKLLKDFEQFEEFLSAHPDPYTHISKKLFEKNLKQVKSSLNEPHTPIEFYKKLASTVALIRDGHSSMYLPAYWMENNRKKFGCFPYEMYLSNTNELFVLKSFNQGEIEPGSKIVSINGVNVDSFLNLVNQYVSFEKESFRNTVIDNSFEKYLYLAFNSSDNLTFKYFKQDTLETVVKNMPMKEWKKFQKNDREEREILISKGEPFAYEKVKEGVGMLSVYSFTAKNFTAYNLFLLKTFKAIRKDNIHSLVIDVRGNYGGSPQIASELFHYIHNGHFKTMGKSSMKVSSPYKEYFYTRYPYLRNNSHFLPEDRHFIPIHSILTKKPGTYINEDIMFNEKPFNEDFEFKGDVYLLTNRDSYSAASSFASTFQCYGMGTIIGEETGGTKIFRANPIAKKLKHSGLAARLSTTKLYTTCYNKEFQGVTPNIEYSPSIFELLSDMDTQLIYTQRVIKKVQKKKEEMSVEK